MHVNMLFYCQIVLIFVQAFCKSLGSSKSQTPVLTSGSSISDLEKFISTDKLLYANTIPDKRATWPRGIVPYEIRKSDFSNSQLTEIQEAMEEFDAKTCVKFKKREREKSYVLIRKGRECKSDVGRLGGKQLIFLAGSCMDKGVVIHELMHAIGFLHEQERSDRDDYVKILWRNVQPKMQLQFARLPKSVTMTTAYDYDSIMHYDRFAFTKNGSPTIETKYIANVGQRKGFSFMDLIEINVLYRCDKEIKKLKLAA